MDDKLTFDHRPIPNPGSVKCRTCHRDVSLPTTEPWVVVDGIAAPPESLESFRCPRCRTRIYLHIVSDERLASDAELDARDDEEAGIRRDH